MPICYDIFIYILFFIYIYTVFLIQSHIQISQWNVLCMYREDMCWSVSNWCRLAPIKVSMKKKLVSSFMTNLEILFAYTDELRVRVLVCWMLSVRPNKQHHWLVDEIILWQHIGKWFMRICFLSMRMLCTVVNAFASIYC